MAHMGDFPKFSHMHVSEYVCCYQTNTMFTADIFLSIYRTLRGQDQRESVL